MKQANNQMNIETFSTSTKLFSKYFIPQFPISYSNKNEFLKYFVIQDILMMIMIQNTPLTQRKC